MEASSEARRTTDVRPSRDEKDGKMAINGPVYFLIREQAKSVATVQALQARMAVLENLQERLMQAIEEVNRHLASEAQRQSSKSAIGASSTCGKRLRFLEADPRSSSDLGKPEPSKSDSLNKDSGIGASDSSLSQAEENKSLDENDELLHLLDIIDQKGLVLLRQVEGNRTEGEDQPHSSMQNRNSHSQLLDNLIFEKIDTQRQLSEVKAERDELRQRLAKLELATQAVTKQKWKVQQELDSTLLVNKSLQGRINKSDESISKAESLGYLTDIARSNIRRKYLQYSEKSRLKVSRILKEANILELQKQLLTYVMENDILRAKLQQGESLKFSNWLKIESKLRKNLKEAFDENQRLQEHLQGKNLEIASLKDKLHSLEEGESESCVKNFGMSSTDDWREPGIQNIYNKRSNLANASPFSPLGYGDFSKTQSLPAMLLKSAQSRHREKEVCQKPFHVYDTNSFTDVPLNQSVESSSSNSFRGEINAKDLVDLSSPIEHNFSSTSTLVQSNVNYQTPLHSGQSVPNLHSRYEQDNLQNWCFAAHRQNHNDNPRNSNTASGAKLINGHLCWKGIAKHSPPTRRRSDDISSICSEFDPLSDDSPSCENFVDSLNLSIPLKPTSVPISQLSSIGDSLHSASLDLGTTSSPVLNEKLSKMHNAKSVDGIRELLLLDNTYGSKPMSKPYGHSNVSSVVLGQSGRHVPVNIVDYMNVANDFSIL